jgi:hypothetical protein
MSTGTIQNPFLYGNPVPPDRFFGRTGSVDTVFSRLKNGESTAIVGEPHVGKTSLLGYLADEKTRGRNLSASPVPWFIEINCHALPARFTPKDFWEDVILQIAPSCSSENLQRHLPVLAQGSYGSYILERFFRQLTHEKRRLVLLIDEFDVLLNHPNFNTAEFFGGLRSIAIGSGSLALIIASRLSVAEMNRRTTEINPIGSPFFNNFTQERLYPLSRDEAESLIDYMLRDSSPIVFSREDRDFVHGVAGGHPFLIQAASATVFQQITGGIAGPDRYTRASQRFYDAISFHFADLWRNLDPLAQAAMVLLSLGELQGKLQGRDFDIKDLEEFDWYEPELRKLREAGVVEVEGEKEWTEHGYFVESGGARWRVSAGAFVWWVTLELLPTTRSGPDFVKWIHDREYEGLFTNKTREKLLEYKNRIPSEFKDLSWKLIRGAITAKLGISI